MEKINLIQHPIENPVDIPVYGTGYIYTVRDGYFKLHELKNMLNSLNLNESEIIYSRNSFIIIEKKLLYKKDLDLSLNMVMIDFNCEIIRDCTNLTIRIYNESKDLVYKFANEHPTIWQKFKENNKEYIADIKKMGID